MGCPVVTVAAGGLPVVETPFGTPVTEAANGRGVAVTKVVGKPGMPVVYETIGVVAPVSYATWDAATAVAVTLSGGNLIVTAAGGTATNQGAHVIAASGKSAGKIYLELALSAVGGGTNVGFGIGTPSSTYTAMGNNATTGVMVFNSGNVYANGGNAGVSFGLLVGTGGTFGVAVDLDNRKLWFRLGAAGNWNTNVANSPVTNVGGIAIPAGTMVPFCTFGSTAGSNSTFTTANFGASAFIGALPSGFTSGWVA